MKKEYQRRRQVSWELWKLAGKELFAPGFCGYREKERAWGTGLKGRIRAPQNSVDSRPEQ